MKTIEQLYNEVISCPRKWIYWDYNDTKVEDIKNIIPDFLSMYNKDCGERLIIELLRAGNKGNCSLIDNVKQLETERKRHIISLFFIGHLLYDGIKEIRNRVNKQIETLGFPQQGKPVETQKQFSFLWILLCLFHDLGYAYEEGKLEIRDAPSLKDIYSKLTKKFNPPIYSVANIMRYDKYRLCKWGVKDHGIWGGQVFNKDMSQIKELLRSNNSDYNNTTLFCTEGVDHIYAFAAWIIICHNMCFNDGNDNYTTCYKCQHLEDFIKPKARCVSLNSNPLLFLFCLADTLEPTKTLKSSKTDPYESRDICKLLEMDISDNVLSFKLQNLEDYKVSDDYKKRLISLNDWLIDVNSERLCIDFG